MTLHLCHAYVGMCVLSPRERQLVGDVTLRDAAQCCLTRERGSSSPRRQPARLRRGGCVRVVGLGGGERGLCVAHGALTAPPGTAARAHQDALTFWLIDEMDAILWAAAKHSFVFPQEQRVPEIKDSLKAEFARSAAILSDRLDGPFLMGEEVTIPDLLATHCINWSIGAGFARVDDKLGNWAKSMRDRPAFKAAATREG